MKPWMIVLASALVAIAAAAGVALPRLALLPHAAILPQLLPLVVVTALAGYALCAILLAAGDLVVGCLLLRHRLARIVVQPGASASDWIAAFEESRLRRLAPALAVKPPTTGTGGTIVVRERFRPFEARREIARLYHVLAARAHFFSAVIVLTAVIALGVAQQHGALQLPLGPVPTVPACLILVGLVLLAVLARLSVDVAAEPLIDLVSRLPVEPAGTVLLRRAVALLEAGTTIGVRKDGIVHDDGVVAAGWTIPDRVIGLVEDGHRALVAAIEHLSATTDGFAGATRSALDGLEAALRSGEQRPAAETASLDVAVLERLHEAVQALTATLERLPRPVLAAERLTGTELAVTPRDADPDLAGELKKLLQEIETAC
ncbi:MAG TPA: hypothetical protein VMF05_02330 [Stellaceae bacterium]|nr:hypothetical protein [Stellaceae bacterium]